MCSCFSSACLADWCCLDTSLRASATCTTRLVSVTMRRVAPSETCSQKIKVVWTQGYEKGFAAITTSRIVIPCRPPSKSTSRWSCGAIKLRPRSTGHGALTASELRKGLPYVMEYIVCLPSHVHLALSHNQGPQKIEKFVKYVIRLRLRRPEFSSPHEQKLFYSSARSEGLCCPPKLLYSHYRRLFL